MFHIVRFPMGRNAIDDEMRKATMFFAMKISNGSGLSASELERALQMESIPPGKNWRRYLRGERNLSADVRDKIARKAMAKGWITKGHDLDCRTTNAYGWIAHGLTLEQTRNYVASQKRSLVVANSTVANALDALKRLVALLDSSEKTGLHPHCFHESFLENTPEDEGEVVRYPRLFHERVLMEELTLAVEKIKAIEFSILPISDPDLSM
jgi:hypothetical protein